MIEIQSIIFLPVEIIGGEYDELKQKGVYYFKFSSYTKAINYYEKCFNCARSNSQESEIYTLIGYSYFYLVYLCNFIY